MIAQETLAFGIQVTDLIVISDTLRNTGLPCEKRALFPAPRCVIGHRGGVNEVQLVLQFQDVDVPREIINTGRCGIVSIAGSATEFRQMREHPSSNYA